ncbi:hypothetical protein [Nocardia sp. NPDC003963]
MVDSITEPVRTAADGPHARPAFAGEQRSRTLTWRVGAPGAAANPRARLCIDHHNCAGYFATLRALAATPGSDHRSDPIANRGTRILVLHTTKPFSAKEMKRAQRLALTELRRLYDENTPEILAYFDRASEHHHP